MATMASHSNDVGIDAGQAELEGVGERDPQPLLPGYVKGTQPKVTPASSGVSANVPTVLTKLRKWGDYDSIGNQVLHTKFIPMKTPLSAEILDNWSLPSQPKHRLTVPEMVAQQAALGRKVGLLLDLSNHDCLYTADIPAGLAYTHVQLVAKELPPREFVDAVVIVVNNFWANHPDEYIAVHCAYGFNRTGFVVCCYLIECCGLSVKDALAAFAESRPPGVKHEQFSNELHRRYGHLMYGHPANDNAPHDVCGSPDDNSSFGCSPSCNSLDLRDMCGSGGLLGFGYGAGSGGGGGSPVPAFTRGATYDCLMAPHSTAAGGWAYGIDGGGRVSTDAQSRSLDGHQTLTFTTSSFATEFRRGSSGGGDDSGAAKLQMSFKAMEVTAFRPRLTQPQAPQGGEQAKPLQGRHVVAQRGQHVATLCKERQLHGTDPLLAEESGEQHGADGYAQPCDMRRSGEQHALDIGPMEQQRQQEDRAWSRAIADPDTPMIPLSSSRPGGVATTEGWGGSSDSMGRSASQQQLQRRCSNDNESLGVNDRVILQTLRQHALGHLSAATIPEESPLTNTTSARGCSSNSLVDCDSSAGLSTPRPAHSGKHKSLETIDWGAAAAVDESGSCVRLDSRCLVTEVETLPFK